MQTVFADRIVWQNDRWVMEKFVVYHFSRDGNVVVATYPAHTRPVELGQTPQQVARLQKRPEEMGLAELKEHIEVLNAQGADVRSLEVQMHLKYSIPMASLVFALVGTPLGIQSHRSARSTGFGLSIIIIFLYYIVMTLGSALGQAGVLPPALAACIQNLLLGVYRSLSLLQERPLSHKEKGVGRFVYGIWLVLVLVLMGGGIAYLGDKIGMLVGRRRLTLFGLRPKHSSVIVTVMTGTLIAGTSLSILAVASHDVRTALFHMKEIQESLETTQTLCSPARRSSISCGRC